MDFGPIPLAQALGAVLAHSVPLAGGGRLRKGALLGPSELAALAAAGQTEVVAARLGPEDIGEDEAALALAQALIAGPGLRLQPVGTGRVNLLADGPGLVRIDPARIAAVNNIDPSITVATVAPWQRMVPDGMVATVKIIAYGVESASILRACAAGVGALALVAPVLHRAVLIETSVGGAEIGKGYRITAERLARLDVTLAPPCVVAHDQGALAAVLADVPVEGALILILTGSATSDIRDVAPAAVRQAGGEVAHFGMPVDPGNLLFVGALRGAPVIGLPGCAKSPALNGADFVLERLICGLPMGRAEIVAMGVGGLLKEIATRPRPRQPAIS